MDRLTRGDTNMHLNELPAAVAGDRVAGTSETLAGEGVTLPRVGGGVDDEPIRGAKCRSDRGDVHGE